MRNEQGPPNDGLTFMGLVGIGTKHMHRQCITRHPCEEALQQSLVGDRYGRIDSLRHLLGVKKELLDWRGGLALEKGAESTHTTSKEHCVVTKR